MVTSSKATWKKLCAIWRLNRNRRALIDQWAKYTIVYIKKRIFLIFFISQCVIFQGGLSWGIHTASNNETNSSWSNLPRHLLEEMPNIAKDNENSIHSASYKYKEKLTWIWGVELRGDNNIIMMMMMMMMMMIIIMINK